MDTGFMVFNERTYPNFIRLLDRLGVASQPSVMNFSVSSEKNGLEYCATNFDTLFAQRRNLFNLPFWRMLREILRFNRESRELYESGDMTLTLGTYLTSHGYSSAFVDTFLVPMGSAIWSADPHQFLQFPAAAFVQFFVNHGILNVIDQPKWRVVSGGSRSYVEPLVRPFCDRVRLSMPVERVRRLADRVEISPRGGQPEPFDQVVIAAHSDQAVREVVQSRLGFRPVGPVRILTHLRYLGYCMNPISIYYCFGADGHELEAIVCKVNNTPWGEEYLRASA